MKDISRVRARKAWSTHWLSTTIIYIIIITLIIIFIWRRFSRRKRACTHLRTHSHTRPYSPFGLTLISWVKGWCWCVEALIAQHNTVLLCQLWPRWPCRSQRMGCGVALRLRWNEGSRVSCPVCQACWSGSVASRFREYTGSVMFWTHARSLT